MLLARMLTYKCIYNMYLKRQKTFQINGEVIKVYSDEELKSI